MSVASQGSNREHPPTAGAVVRASGLSKHFGSHQAVKDASFTVQRGDVYGFLGPNGSGKSTTISMLLGLVRPSAGSIELFELGTGRRGAGLARVGAIIEYPAFYPYLSGRDNLRALAKLRPGVTNRRVDEVLEIIGLQQAARRKFGNYSLGMKQRLGIGWTLLHDPELLVLDEPTNGLDPAGMQEVRQLILRLSEQGKTIFLSSHLLNEVEQVCNRVAIVQRGAIITEGPVDEIIGGDERLLVRVDDMALATRVLQQIEGVRQIDERGRNELAVIAPGVRAGQINARLVGAGVEVDELRQSRATLEEAFLELTSGNAAETTPKTEVRA